MTTVESICTFVLTALAYVFLGFIAVFSYLTIGVIWVVFPFYAVYVLMKTLWFKAGNKLQYLLQRGK
jgi:hypothetical protein